MIEMIKRIKRIEYVIGIEKVYSRKEKLVVLYSEFDSFCRKSASFCRIFDSFCRILDSFCRVFVGTTWLIL